MRGFKANNCRLCQKVFCCKKCRMKHEKTTHKVFPDCDICVYGIFFFANIDDNFLQHLESSHLPVHCVYCKQVFSSIEDLLQHKKCDYFQTKEHSPKTPFNGNPAIRLTTDDNDSPIFQELQRQQHLNYILATSTPMQMGEEPNLMFDKSKEAITPVDKPIRVTSKSIIKKTDSVKCNEELSKRRVTFGETPSSKTVDKMMSENMTGDQNTPPSKLLESLNGQHDQLLNQKSHDSLTPGVGISTCQFYSAKTETGQFYSAKTDVSSKPLGRDNGYIKNSIEEFTPVGVPNKSKFINVKGDIYKNQDEETNGVPETPEGQENIGQKEFKHDYLNNVSMELCTPGPSAKNVNSLCSGTVNGQDSVNKEPINESNNGIFSIIENVEDTEKNETKNALHLCTPAKPSNTGKIVVKGDIYKNSEQDISQIKKINEETEERGKNDNQNESKNSLETKNKTNAGATDGHDTLWLSAINLEETEDDLKQQDIENTRPAEINKHTLDQNGPLLSTPVSPPRNNQRRVSIVMPTPILKTTNFQMKFHFPAHLSSTPIIPGGGAVRVNQTKSVQDLPTRVVQHQTPYKTPQGKLCELIQRKLVDANRRRILAPLTDIEAGPSTSSRDIVPLENIKEDYSASNAVENSDMDRNTLNKQYEDNYPSLPSYESETGVSVSSMTESNLWTSMTRIVKSVLGGFSTASQNNSDFSINNSSNSIKRQLSDSDTGDFLEAPRLKRFKFTDIKCRKSIRDLGALELPRSLPVRAPPLASIEIMKSVSTFYGHQSIRIQCDKATQTDNYLMYGLHPHV